MSFEQTPITTVYARGGSSKALFLKSDDIPPPGPLRDNVLLRLIGSPDPTQIDGMGGSRIVTSKIAIIGTSQREDADIDYEFAQCGVEERSICYDGNCGNISSGVGPFAIDEGLISKPFKKGLSPAEGVLTREVRIWQIGTKKLLVAHVPVDEKTGKSVSKGDFAIAAVPGTGAPILMDFRNTVGASRNQGALPTGHAIDTVTIGQKKVDITVCDVANIIVYVCAEDMGISGYETAKDISRDKGLIARCKELRGKAANLAGMCKDWEKVDEQSPGLPMVCMVASPKSSEGDLSARLLLNNSCHDSMAGSGAICIGACSRISGSIVNRSTRPAALDEQVLQISHPLGIMPVWVKLAEGDSDSGDTEYIFNTLSFVRTSRRIMEGVAYVPVEVWEGRGNTVTQTNGHTNRDGRR